MSVSPAVAMAPLSDPSPPLIRDLTPHANDTVAQADDALDKGQTLSSDLDPIDPLALAPPRLSQRRKWALLAVFTLAYFIDCWNNSAMYVYTAPICRDLAIVVEQNSWIITSYSACFAASLLFWGRMADIFSAKKVFVWGMAALGVLNIVISFLPEKISFLIVRALSGFAAAAVIPSAYRLIVMTFEPEELGRALAVYGFAGAVGAATGSIMAGVVNLIPASGQMAGWRWFLRIMGSVILPVAAGSVYWIPPPPIRTGPPIDNKWKRLDLTGSLSMLVAILPVIIGLTLGASNGWRTPQFLVPFLLSIVIFPLIFLWEARLPFDYALLPPSVWRIPNVTVYIIFALYLYSWLSFFYLPLLEVFVGVNGDTSLIAAVRLLPFRFAGILISILITLYPRFVAIPRWPIVLGITGATGAFALIASADGIKGVDYWKFAVPAGVIGGAGIVTTMIATNVGIMTAAPPDMAGVAGATFQVACQVGQVVALSIQGGLLTIQPGDYGNWVNVRTLYIFGAGWGIVWLAGFLALYRPPKNDQLEKVEDDA